MGQQTVVCVPAIREIYNEGDLMLIVVVMTIMSVVEVSDSCEPTGLRI